MGTHCKVVIDASGMLMVGQGPGSFCKYTVFPCSPLLYTEQDVSHSLLKDLNSYMGSTDPSSGIQESQFSVFKTRMLVSLNSSNLCFLMGRVTPTPEGNIVALFCRNLALAMVLRRHPEWHFLHHPPPRGDHSLFLGDWTWGIFAHLCFLHCFHPPPPQFSVWVGFS